MNENTKKQELEQEKREYFDKNVENQTIKRAALFFGVFSLAWPVFVMSMILFAEFFTYNSFHATFSKVMSYMALLYIFSISAGVIAFLCVVIGFYVSRTIEWMKHKKSKEKEKF